MFSNVNLALTLKVGGWEDSKPWPECKMGRLGHILERHVHTIFCKKLYCKKLVLGQPDD